MREEFDTGLAKIRHEIKSQLVPHGFFGSVTTSSYERMVTVETIGHKGEPAIRTVCCCKSPRAFERAVNASMPPHLMV